VGPTLAHCRNSQYAGAFVGLNLHTRCDCWKESTRGVLRAGVEARVGLLEAKFAIIGCATDVLLDRIELIEKEQSLPFPQLSHVWARRSREIKTSYLFLDLTKNNFEDIIGYARLGGFRYIVAYDGSWSVGQYGNYSVNLLWYPGGDSDLVTVSQAIHQAGLKLGMHVVYMVIDKASPWVVPTPAEGFLMYPGLQRTLAAAIHPGDTFVPTTTSPDEYLPKGDKGPGTRYTELRGYDLRIDDEIITYTDLKTTPPYGFVLSPPSAVTKAHSAGASIENFAEYLIDKGYYLPDLTGSLYIKLVDEIASAIEKFKFDFIYPDALEEPLSISP
jgi:hypothetical protein